LETDQSFRCLNRAKDDVKRFPSFPQELHLGGKRKFALENILEDEMVKALSIID
jgi:hypothetical protein